MVTRSYDGGYAVDADPRAAERVEARRTYRDVGAQIFVWVAWSLAFAFWAFTMSSFFGILQAIASNPPGGLMGGVDSGGANLILWVLGLIVLGLVIAYGAARWATRDRALDPVTEASTARLYDEGGS
ncbi:MAG TPA: hypothetical protein VHV27_08400 [Phenylobacterium sp.]|jgi:hypothetical protein|nr:hypothetical protein [Phenylobacterium sp.]